MPARHARSIPSPIEGAGLGAEPDASSNILAAAQALGSTQPPSMAQPSPAERTNLPESVTQNLASTTPTTTPPTLTINGDNSAIIQIGETYNDLGATITGPEADLNLGITTYLNGTLTSNIVIDTAQVATDTLFNTSPWTPLASPRPPTPQQSPAIRRGTPEANLLLPDENCRAWSPRCRTRLRSPATCVRAHRGEGTKRGSECYPVDEGQGGAPCFFYPIIQTEIFRLENAVTIWNTILPRTYLRLSLPGIASLSMIRASDFASEK